MLLFFRETIIFPCVGFSPGDNFLPADYPCILIVFPLNFILCGLHGLCDEMFLPEASRSVLRDTASRVFFPRNVRTFCASDIGKQISSCVLDVPTCENL